MRQQVERELAMKTDGQRLVDWMAQQASGGASLRVIADRLTGLVGIKVSHESVRQWMKAG